MLVKHIMTTPVLSAPSDTTVLEAAKMMKDKGIERLPIVDRHQLVGIVTKDRVLRASPSSATSLSLHEINYLYSKLTLREIMQKDPLTVGPDDTVESAVRLAQENKIGSLPVVERGDVVGILTTNDFFLLVLNPILGIGESGARVIIRHCENAAQIASAMACVAEIGCDLTNAAYLPSRRGGEKDLLIHIADDNNATKLVQSMKTKGRDAEIRQR
jgi:acetoin utilization protein AcuB